ncbi:transmembrane protein 201 homolog [Lucilia cuprina]|uniref:transmembrane protein 201 homolog n=1 Tax=Lucilia cuprina TaxID=7375 RepID=UPI001F053ABA|nr:transmembrane protein 201 homolog [Lucilia cuprina]
MNNNVLLSLAMSIIPMLAIGFVVLLVIYKIYIKIRSRFNVTVNCWFCNQNTKVPYLDANSWTCPSCEQYNGFDKDGDYNREIYEQLDCSRSSERFNVSQPSACAIQQTSQNGFCEMCNEAQRLKVEKLAQFEPKNESHWDEELKVYKAQLEDQYRLCSTCDRHLNKVLREKKKMVLGSKFLDFIIKGAETLKQPHLNQIQHANQQKRKQRLRTLITVLTLINLSCLISSLPSLNKEHFTQILGESLGHQIFLITSHIIALTKVMGSYFATIKEHAVVTKISLFSRTLFMMIMYSLGLKVSHFNFSSLYISICPFAILALAFMHNVVDGFRLTRYTAMMVVWSLFAGGLIEENLFSLTPQLLMFLTSLLTCLMAYSSKPEPSPKLHDNTANSFHKIYSEDYLSDEETMSMLSQQLNGSCVSMRSVRSNRSLRAPSPLMHANTKRSPRLTKSPLTSSAFSLHQLPRTQLSPNSSFRSYAGEENQTLRGNFATPMAMPVTARPGLFASNLELNCRERPQSTIFGMNASVANSTVLNNSFSENNKSHFANSTHANEASFYTAANNTANTSMFVNNHTFVAPSSHSGLHSPFSVSSSAVYHHQQQPHNQRTNTHHKLLSPTRFSTNNLTSSNASWLSGGYFNQRQSMADIPSTGLIIPTAQTQSLITPMEECLSRSSSHSSGFESQNGRLNGNNMSRENSLCPDFSLDYHQRTLTHENINNSFQPIDSPSLGAFSPRPSILSNPNLNSFPLEHTDIWKQPNFTRKSHNNNTNTNFSRNSIDSFNLRKINEELPSIKRGDLLKKWKEGQTIS